MPTFSFPSIVANDKSFQYEFDFAVGSRFVIRQFFGNSLTPCAAYYISNPTEIYYSATDTSFAISFPKITGLEELNQSNLRVGTLTATTLLDAIAALINDNAPAIY